MGKKKKQPNPDSKKTRRLRIMWNSNAVWAHSGYSTQSRNILYRLLADGWPVAHTAFYGLEGGIINVNGLTCYPKLGDPWGSDAVLNHARDWKADVTFCFQDSWPMNTELVKKFVRYIPYVPIDRDPVPPPILEKMSLAYRIVSFSEFGKRALEESGFASELIVHGIDTSIFKPMDKLKARAAFNLPPDLFMFGMVAANKDNPPRKSFQRVMDAFKMFHEKHPQSGIFFQTLLHQTGGFPIDTYAKFLGIEGTVYSLPPYDTIVKLTSENIAMLMNSFDCLVNPSYSEGFGIPVIEAQACGKPVIVNDALSMPELIIEGETGFKTKVAFKWFCPSGGYFFLPDVQSIYECMEKVYAADRKEMGKKAREQMLKNYDIDVIVKTKWIPFLEKLENEIYGEKL